MATKKDKWLERTADIAKMVPYWEQVTTIVEGLKAMKAAGETYLPKFEKETSTAYHYRLSLAKMTNVYRDVLEGLATKPFEEEVTLLKGDGVPNEIRDFVENVDGAGSNLTVFSALTFFNAINYAIDWIFVDYPKVTTNTPLSVAEAKAKNIRPFWSRVLAKNILEIRTEMVGAERVLTYMRFLEPSLSKMDPDKIRVFERIDGVVSWQLRQETEDDFVVIDSGVLSIPVIPLVPVITGRRDGTSWRFFPCMEDAADLQVTLYQNESSLEFTKNLSCYPMLAANGMRPAKKPDGTPEEVAVGPMRVLYGVPNENGSNGEWRFIEPNANSLEFMQKNIEKTKQDLRELGRQPLTALSTQLTTVTTSIAAGKAKSAVSAWALALKDALENALVITAMWMKIDYDPQVNVYTGFDNVSNDSTDLDTIDAGRGRGDISLETYWQELKRRKVLSPEFDADSERTRLLEEVPSDMEGSLVTTTTEGNTNV